MQYRKYIYGLTFLFFGFCFQVSGQNRADFQIVQSESATSDSLFLDFRIRSTVAPFFMGGHNLVFRIDTSIVDTSVYKVLNQGVFGGSSSYAPVRVEHVSASVYQLVLFRRFPAPSGGVVLPTAFVNAGRLVFFKKKCGLSTITYPNGPFSTIVDWLGNGVIETGISVAPLNVTKKIQPKALLTLSKTAVCANSTINITAEQKTGASDFTLFSKNTSGVITSVAPSQASGVFNSITVVDSTSFFVTFKTGTCTDTTEIKKVAAAPASPPLVITSTNASPCLGDKVTFTASPLTVNNKYVWKLAPSNTSAVIVGTSTGLGVNSIVVDLKGTTAYTVTISVQDTNQVGCVGNIVMAVARPVACSFNADFEVNGSSFAVSSCKNANVVFRDASTVSGAIKIVKWDWDFGTGANPETFSTTDPLAVVPDVTYSSSGVIGVKLVITTDGGLKDSVTKSPTITVLASFSEVPKPTCGSSSCNEVNFNWQTLQGATDYKVRYKKGKNGTFTNYTSIGVRNTFKVNASSAGMGGSLDFNDTKNDTVFFQLKALAGACDSTVSDIVFCRPSYCSTADPTCLLPPVSLAVPPAACKGSVVQLKADFTPKKFYLTYPTVRLSWNNGALDTSHVFNVNIVNDISQDVKLLIIDTAKTNCYSLNVVSVPVTPYLDVKPDLGIQSLECDKITFVWKHVPNAVKYQVRYSAPCIPTQDWIDVPLNGLAEFYEVNGLPTNCQLDFKVRALGGCNTTQSDTLISPPTCTCYIGHIASSDLKSCALDTTEVDLSNIQLSDWLISWKDPISAVFGTPSKDTTFSFVPTGAAGTVYKIEYILTKLDGSCSTNGYINDTIDTQGVGAKWSPPQTQFCISDAISLLSKSTSIFPNKTAYSFLGDGVKKVDSRYFFDPREAGLGIHNVTFNSCGSAVTQALTVVNTPCVSTIVDAGFLKRPEGLYTACDGTIFMTDAADLSLYRYKSDMIDGVPEVIVKSKGGSASAIDIDGNVSVARFGEPYGIVLNENTGNDVYFADFTKGKVKRIELDKQKVSTAVGLIKADVPDASSPIRPIADGLLSGPKGLAINEKADTIYVSDVENNNIKAFTINGLGDVIKLVAGGGAGSMPTQGKNVSLTQPFAIGADSQGLSVATRDNNLLRYGLATDIISEIVTPTIPDFRDGAPGVYRTRTPNGITQKIGDWVYFSDQLNYSLRRFNVNTGFVETVAGSPPAQGRKAGTANGAPFDSRFSSPGALAFNIKGYIDILDGGVANTVRRYYLPDWSLEGFWKGFDTTYVVKCDHDTITPDYSTGILRLISGKDLTAVSQGKYFAPKDTGNYLLGYYTKIGRCDTTFFKNVYVRNPPIPTMQGDTVCSSSYLFSATTKGDTTLRYKWYGPGRSTLISVSDTSRTLSVTQTGRYYVEIFYGKAKQCSVLDSADVFIVPPRVGVIEPLPPLGNALVTTDSVTVCQGNLVTLSVLDDAFPLPSLKHFVWSTGDTTRNIVAKGSANYSVTALDSLGCEVNAEYKVIQIEVPNVCIKASDATGANLGWGQYMVSTFAGRPGVSGAADGIGSAASFRSPWGLAIYNDTLYVTDKNQLVRAVSIRDARVSKFLGQAGDFNVQDSVASVGARFNSPNGIRIDKDGNFYIVNNGNHTVYKYDRKKNLYYNFAGSGTNGLLDTTGALAEFDSPKDIEVDAAGHVFVTDFNNHNIRVIDQARNVNTYAGSPILNTPQGTLDGKSTKALFNWPWGLALSPTGALYVSEDGNHSIRKISIDTNVALVAGTIGTSGSNGGNYGQTVPGLTAGLEKPWNLTVDPAGNVFFADAANRLIRRLDKNGNVTTIAGALKVTGSKNGKGDTATFSGSTGMAFYPKTGEIFVADQDAHIIRKLTRNKVVYVCNGAEYRIGDSCTTVSSPSVDVSWQKRTSAGLAAVNINQAFTDTATYIVTLTPKINGIVCGQASVDSVVVKWNVKEKVSVLSPISTFYPCKSDTLKMTATAGFSQYFWFKRVNNTYSSVDTSMNNNSIIKLALKVANVDSAFYAFAIRNPKTGCFDTSTNELKVKLFPRIDTAFADTFRCEGRSTRFIPANVDSTKFSYSWNFGVTPTVTSSKSITNHVFATQGTYQVSMFGRYRNLPVGFSCIDTVTKPVRITARPRLDLTINGLSDTARFCSTNPVQADLLATVLIDVNAAGSPYEFAWKEANPKGGKLDSVTNLDNTIARPLLRLGEKSSLFGYKVLVKDVNGCVSNPDSAYAQVSEVPPIIALSKRDTSICKGNSVALNIVVTSGKVPFTFVWTNSTEVNVTDPLNPIFTPDPNGASPKKYLVSVTDADNCGIGKDSINISQYEMSLATSSNLPAGLCRTIAVPNPTANLTVSATNIPVFNTTNYGYRWTNLTSGTALGVNAATLPNVGTAGDYEVEVTNNVTGCIRKDTISVDILNKPENPILANGTPIITCSAKTIDLNARFAPPIKSKSDSVQFSWRVRNNVPISSGNDSGIVYNLSPADTGLVPIKVFAQNRCGIDSSLVAQVLINGNPNPISDLRDTVACMGSGVQLTASRIADPNLNYAWSGPDNILTTISDDASRQLIVSKVGKYWVRIYDKNTPACFVLDSATVRDIPPVLALSKRDTSICKGSSVALNIAVTTGKAPFTFVWTNSTEVNVADPLNPIITPDPNGTSPKKYLVSVTDADNCGVAKDSINISQYEMSLAISSSVSAGLCRTIAIPNPTTDLTVVATNTPALGAANDSYRWTNLTSGTALGVNAATLPNVGTAGNYEVEVTNNVTGCIRRDTILVDILNKPENPILANGTPIITCSVRTIDLNARFAPPVKSKSDSIQFSWRVRTNAPISSANDSSIVYNLSAADTGLVPIKVFAQNRCGIDSSLVVQVLIKASSKPDSDLRDTLVCAANVQLTASLVKDSTFKYAWFGPDNQLTAISDDTNRRITVSKAGKYWVRIYDKNNISCFSFDSSIVAITPPGKGIVRVVGSSTNTDSIVVCFGASVQLEMKEATAAQPKFLSYKWNTSQLTPTITANGTVQYVATALDATGCIVVDSFKVVAQPLPVPCIRVEDSLGNSQPIANKIALICPGSSYQISDPCNPTFGLATDSLIVRWQRKVGTGVFLNTFPKGQSYPDTAIYIVTVTPKLDGVACINSAKDTVTVKWKPKAPISLSAAGNSTICSGGNVDLTATTGFQKYIWYTKPANVPVLSYLDTTSSNNFTASATGADPLKFSSLSFGVIGYDQFGCGAKAEEQSKAIIPVPKMDFTSVSTCLGQPTKFVPASLDTVNTFLYTWDFGDLNSTADVSSKAIDSYTYSKSGTYTVKMIGDFYIPFECADTVEKIITIALPGTIGLQINGGTDTLKFCGAVTNALNLKASVVPNPNNPSAVFSYKWSEVAALSGGGLVTSTTSDATTANPIKRSNESSSLFGYMVRGVDGGNCSTETDTVFVRVSDIPDFGISVSPASTICRGQELTFTPVDSLAATSIGNIYSYEWDTAGVVLNSDLTNPVLKSRPMQSASYRLNVKNLTTSCAASAFVPIKVFGPEISEVKVANLAGCGQLDSVAIETKVAYATLPYQSIKWTDSSTNATPTSLYNPNNLNVKSWPDTLHIYKLIVIDASGCADTAFARVESGKVYPPLFSIVSNKDTGVCVNGSVKVRLNVTRSRGAFDFVWKDKSGNAIAVDNSNPLQPIVSVSNSGEYIVTMNDFNTKNCGSISPKDSINFNSFDMGVTLSGSDPKMCRTISNPIPSANFQADVVDNPVVSSATYEYVWTNLTKGQILPSTSSTLTGITEKGEYQVQVTNTKTSCVRKASHVVRILNSPEAPDLIFEDVSPCNNEPVKLKTAFASSVKSLADSIVYEWFVHDSSFAITSDSTIIYRPLSADTGAIEFKVVAKNRCSVSADSIVSPKLVSGARARLDVSATEVFLNKEVVFTNNSTRTDSLNVLKLGDGSVQNFGKGNGVTLPYVYPAEGEYKVVLFANNTSGCHDTARVLVKVIDKINVFLPNVFSPSAFDENNRFFRLYGINISPQDFSLVVYNRWGQVVYSTNDLTQAMNRGWDGSDNGGEAQMGVYTYIMKGMFGNGKSISKTGTVSLIR